MIVTRSFSKGYGLAGIRLGYLVARPEMVEQLEQDQGLVQLRYAEPGRGGRRPVGPGISPGDPVQDHGDPRPADGRAASDGLHGSR